MLRALARILGTAAVLAVLAPSAHANGRFPSADQLVVDPSDPQHLVIRATYGILQSHDGGATWGWICEEAVGFGGFQDPAIAITADGSILVATLNGLSVSHDDGCTWSKETGPLSKPWSVDVTVDPSTPTRALAITADDGDGSPQVVIAESLDDGVTWAPLIERPADLYPQTIEVARADPLRLYTSGLIDDDALGGAIERSDDGGLSWARIPMAIPDPQRPFVSGVDPANADVVYVRVDGDEGDRLVVSQDGAETFTDALAVTGRMLGFALSPDGQRVAAGALGGGLYIASSTDLSFSQVSDVTVRCLTWTAAGLYICSDEGLSGYSIGLSQDEGATVAPVYRTEVLVEKSCPASTPVATMCPAYWPGILDQLANQGGAGGGGGASQGGGGQAPGPPPSDASPGGGGCACAVPTIAPSWSWSWSWSLAALGAFALRARRRRRPTAEIDR